MFTREMSSTSLRALCPYGTGWIRTRSRDAQPSIEVQHSLQSAETHIQNCRETVRACCSNRELAPRAIACMRSPSGTEQFLLTSSATPPNCPPWWSQSKLIETGNDEDRHSPFPRFLIVLRGILLSCSGRTAPSPLCSGETRTVTTMPDAAIVSEPPHLVLRASTLPSESSQHSSSLCECISPARSQLIITSKLRHHNHDNWS